MIYCIICYIFIKNTVQHCECMILSFSFNGLSCGLHARGKGDVLDNNALKGAKSITSIIHLG